MMRMILVLLPGLMPCSAGELTAEVTQRALKIVAQADMLALGPVGIAGKTSEAEKAFWKLHFGAPDRSWTETLLKSKNPVAQAYAATSIHLREPSRLKAIVSDRKGLRVKSIVGCIASEFRFEELEKHLARCVIEARARKVAAARVKGQN